MNRPGKAQLQKAREALYEQAKNRPAPLFCFFDEMPDRVVAAASTTPTLDGPEPSFQEPTIDESVAPGTATLTHGGAPEERSAAPTSLADRLPGGVVPQGTESFATATDRLNYLRNSRAGHTGTGQNTAERRDGAGRNTVAPTPTEPKPLVTVPAPTPAPAVGADQLAVRSALANGTYLTDVDPFSLEDPFSDGANEESAIASGGAPAAADRDANGDWVPPILRGFTPDADRRRGDLPQRHA